MANDSTLNNNEASGGGGGWTPSPSFVKQLLFTDALEEVIDDKKITRLEWKNEEIFGVLRDGKLMIHRDGKFFDWVISSGDLFAEDWVIIK